jgi:hypothetical protein
MNSANLLAGPVVGAIAPSVVRKCVMSVIQLSPIFTFHVGNCTEGLMIYQCVQVRTLLMQGAEW